MSKSEDADDELIARMRADPAQSSSSGSMLQRPDVAGDEVAGAGTAGVTGAGVADTEASSSAADSASYRSIGIDGPRVKSLIDCSVCERTSRLLPHQLSRRRR